MNSAEIWLNRSISASDEELFEDIARFGIGTRFAEDLVKQENLQDEIAIGFQAIEDLKELGRRIFKRISMEFFGLVCGSDVDDVEDRRKILNATGIADAAVMAIIAGLIGKYFGADAALCAAVSSLILRKIIRPGGDEVCKFWKDKYL